MNPDKKIVAVIVTYNRKELLLECLTAILNQTYPVSSIIIVDNASSDGTEEALRKEHILDNPIVDYCKMPTNTGGSGGFYKGLEIIKTKNDVDWAWIMDDDTIPMEDALYAFVQDLDNLKNKKNISFLASCVKGMQNEPMNVPNLETKVTGNGYPDWYMNLKNSMVKISCATFVSLLINQNAIQKCGLPCRDYFIWGDDSEYTKRLTTFYGPAYLSGNSWVCHKRRNAKAISIENEDDITRIKNYFYFYRNSLINSSVYEGMKCYLKQLLKYIVLSIKILVHKNGFLKFITIQKGIWSSVLSKKRFKRYIYDQLNLAENKL